MAFERKQYYPEHDRTSCSDADPCNAEAGGSHGCERCTAIMMDERDALAERCERLEAALSDAEGRLYRLDISRLNAGDRHQVDVLLNRLQTAMTKESQ